MQGTEVGSVRVRAQMLQASKHVLRSHVTILSCVMPDKHCAMHLRHKSGRWRDIVLHLLQENSCVCGTNQERLTEAKAPAAPEMVCRLGPD